jgi:glycosyltransferase involved in cell wall biosynthesis
VLREGLEQSATAATAGSPSAEKVDLSAADSQARRDHVRLQSARDEVLALRRRVLELEHSPSRRMLAPLRRVFHRVLPLVGRVDASGMAAVVPGRGRVLVIDNEWPQPDKDSGSVDIVNLMNALRHLGFDALLGAAIQHDGIQPARDRLIAQGIRCLQPTDAISVEHWIKLNGTNIDLCVLCRVYCGGEFLQQVLRDCGYARIIFNTVDLNFLREERRARLTGDTALLALIGELREREEFIIRNSDASIVVSAAEQVLLRDSLPDCVVECLPLARALRLSIPAFAERAGIGFVGGFAHAPNVDAVRYFLDEIWPLVLQEAPDCTMTIVGADVPADLLASVPGNVRLLGQLSDIGPWLDQLRLTVAPLRYGAGAKGKVASSLSAGVPCIATTIAAEGMDLTGADGVVVAATPAAFASSVVRLLRDEARWTAASRGAIAYAERTLSPTVWQARLDVLLRRLGL